MQARHARILVVDDDPESREVVRLALRRDGHEVYEASSGDEALAMFDATRDLDLLVLDLHMPGRSGVNVLRDLRGRRCAIPALFITGSADPGFYTVAAFLGARVLLKPLALDRLGDVTHWLLHPRA